MIKGRETRDRQGGMRVNLKIDWPLLVGILLLISAGLAISYSAGGASLELVEKQALRLGAGLLAMLVAAQIPPQLLKRWTPAVFLLAVAMLVAVAIIGTIGKGAQRWLDLYLIRVQPSELAKLAVPMAVAWYFAERVLPPSPRDILVAIGLILVPVLLIFDQPDLGTALLVAMSGFAVVFFAGISWKLIAALGASGLLAAPLGWYFLHDYQRNRILTLIDPQRDPLGSGYHIIQSTIAVGSGGGFGKGWLNGTQAHLDFIPESSTDFIFAVVAEEFGLTGGVLLLGLYFFLLVRGLYIANRAQDTYSRLLAGGIIFTLFFYVFVNIGMVTGLMPVVGVPLPLISYGGSSTVTLMLGFGMLMSMQAHRRSFTS